MYFHNLLNDTSLLSSVLFWNWQSPNSQGAVSAFSKERLTRLIWCETESLKLDKVVSTFGRSVHISRQRGKPQKRTRGRQIKRFCFVWAFAAATPPHVLQAFYPRPRLETGSVASTPTWTQVRKRKFFPRQTSNSGPLTLTAAPQGCNPLIDGCLSLTDIRGSIFQITGAKWGLRPSQLVTCLAHQQHMCFTPFSTAF